MKKGCTCVMQICDRIRLVPDSAPISSRTLFYSETYNGMHMAEMMIMILHFLFNYLSLALLFPSPAFPSLSLCFSPHIPSAS